jgi:hypothetical protein
MAAVTPPGAGPEAMLEDARQLLHNPPGLHASPSVVEQWCHDVDQLIIAAINTLPHRGRQVNHPGGVPVSLAPSAPRAPAACLATVDLWAELEHRRSGDDGRITIERHRERHRKLDGSLVWRTPPL